MIDIIYKRNCVYQVAYHVVFCTKYRCEVFTGEVAKRLAVLASLVCTSNNWKIIAREIQPDYIHLFVSIPPVVSISTAVKKLKGITARKLFLEFPDLKKKLWNGPLWSPSYYVGTAGNVSAEIIRKYIERTEHMKNRR